MTPPPSAGPVSAEPLSTGDLRSDRLRDCLGEGGLLVHGMPVVSLRDGSVVGVEMLARRRTRSREVVLPAQFLPRIDECGLWVDLDQAVLAEALRMGRGLPEAVSIGGNLSADSLSRPDLGDWLLGALSDADVSPGRLHLELTETSVLHVDQDVR